ncbi:undecaprenyl-diphosphate phosphatase [Desulfonatronovibrio hydrogenovorans]|uniref:undecaprenyl-diphosphate phosphatase n=1 Tax=Desulfonatronovibrio hydrogenovorans TaxID=53245 RepID=UPI00048B9621|nr:undecaprenyl-diphosphate phosphatase [Desulfonatronovibrio hydrogenovorans]
MSVIEAIIFGIVQGITEFLPVSSTAHIVITELLLGYHFPGLAYEIFLHLASVLAVCIYFRKDLWEVVSGFFGYLVNRSQQNRVRFFFGWYIIVATLITGTLGLLLKNQIGDAMKTPAVIAGALALTGTFLIFIEQMKTYGHRTPQEMTFKDAFLVGLGQSVAILPGISRSGATLITALWLGLSRDTAVRYSFLLAIPIILGSSVLMFGEVSRDIWSEIGIIPLTLSFISSFIFSWIGIVWLINFLMNSRLIYFALYCFTVSGLVYFFVDPAVTF